jgi:hypothetical protein
VTRIKRVWLAAGLATSLMTGVMAGGGSVAMAAPGDKACPDFSTGKIELVDGPTQLTYTAPSGHHIKKWCVKAGSAEQGDGPEGHAGGLGVFEVTISHSSGKEISHYSVMLCAKGTQQ